MVVIFERY